MSRCRRAYIDFDTLYVISEAVRFLADLRGIGHDPETGALDDADLLHLLASLTLHAQTWMHLAIEQTLDDEHAYLTPRDIDHILGGARPDPVGWLDT